jgi:phosphate transport system permease protein
MTKKNHIHKAEGFAVKEKIFRGLLYIAAICVLFLLVGFFITLPLHSLPSIKEFGLGFVYGKVWKPAKNELGALPFIIGTLYTSFIALFLSIPFSLSIALFLGEYFRKGPISTFLKSSVELLAGIPSIIYGFWGIFVLVPIVQKIQLALGIAPYGVGIFTSSIILTIMILPYSASIGREVIQLVPDDLKEAAYSLGATRFEVIRKVILPYARSGIFAGIVLSLGRALGETMAVTMLIGNQNKIPKGIFSPANTMASLIANDFAETTEELYLSAIIEIGLILFLLTMIINMIGRVIIKKTSVTKG